MWKLTPIGNMVAFFCLLITFGFTEVGHSIHNNNIEKIKLLTVEGLNYQNVEDVFYNTIIQSEINELYDKKHKRFGFMDRLDKIRDLCLGTDNGNFPVGTFSLWLVNEIDKPRSDSQLRDVFSFFKEMENLEKYSEEEVQSLDPSNYVSDTRYFEEIIRLTATLKKFVLLKRGFYSRLSEKQLAQTPRKEVTDDTNIKTVFCKIGEEGVIYLDLINETLGTSLWYGSPAEIWPIEEGKLKAKNNWSFTAVSPSGSNDIGQMSWEHRPAILKKKYSRNNWSWSFGINLKTVNENMSYNDSDKFFSNIPLFGRVFNNKTIKCRYNLPLEKYNELLKFHPVDLSEPFDVLERDN